MTPYTLTYKSSSINYYSFGLGHKPVACFHGYGESAASFSFLEKTGGNEYAFYAIDLPFHGQTKWNETLDFTPQDLAAILQKIICEKKTETGTTQFKNEPFSLLGYSLGGRICLQAYEMMPDKIDKIVLLAPDGLKVNGWYWLATQTYIGNRLFAYTMKYPGWFFGLIKLLNRLKLINQSVFKFVNHYIGEPALRQELYQRWTVLRKIKPHLNIIKAQIKTYLTPVRLVYGKHDRIILSKVGNKFTNGIEKQCEIIIIAAGHQVLHERHAGEILNALHN